MPETILPPVKNQQVEKELAGFHMQLEVRLIGHYLQVLERDIEEQLTFIASLKEILQQYLSSLQTEDVDLVDETLKLKERVKKALAGKSSEQEGRNYDGSFPEFNEEVEQYISFLEPQRIREQDSERFDPQQGDSWIIKTRKKGKKFGYNLSQVPVKISNKFRRLFRREEKPLKIWLHAIPLQQLVRLHFKEELGLSLLPLRQETLAFLCSSSQKVRQIVSEPDRMLFKNEHEDALQELREWNGIYIINELLAEGEKFKSSLKSKAVARLNNVFKNFATAYHKVGTFELSAQKFSEKRISKKHEKVNAAYLKTSQGWNNTLFVLLEEWQMNTELKALNYTLQQRLELIQREFSHKIQDNFLPHISAIAENLQQNDHHLADFAGDRIALKSLLLSQRRNILKELRREKIPGAIETILQQQLPATVDDIEVVLGEKIEELPRRQALSEKEDFTREMRTSEIHFISLHEVIRYEGLPEFQEVIKHAKSKIVQDLDQVQRKLIEIDSISDFTLESALALLSDEDKTAEATVTLAREGLQRAIKKCQELETDLVRLQDEVNGALKKATNSFNARLLKLTAHENIYEIYMGIARAKALQRSKEYRTRIIKTARNTIPLISKYSRERANKLMVLYTSLRNQYGLAKAPTLISAEISDYLAEVQSAISLLPYVYQRLFDIAPLKDKNFYEERTREMALMNKAFKNWEKGHFAPVVIVGEKGAGATTLINFFLSKQTTTHKVLRINNISEVFEEESLVAYFKTAIKQEDLADTTAIIEFLHNQAGKYIIVVENLQQLFLRKVDGFKALKLLLHLISATNDKVFWINTCTTYAWQYLQKTNDIGDFYGYINYLEALSDEQIVSIILKRHRVSGYNIHFEPSALDRTNKHYRRLNPDQKQQYLQQHFFAALNRFAKNNLSLALIYWLRSTQNVKGDTISIGSMKGISFTFLSALSNDKLTILHALLLHDGLSTASLLQVLNKDLSECKMLLQLMYDDGILVKKEDVFLINPLLYRQTVNLLISKNFLH